MSYFYYIELKDDRIYKGNKLLYNPRIFSLPIIYLPIVHNCSYIIHFLFLLISEIRLVTSSKWLIPPPLNFYIINSDLELAILVKSLFCWMPVIFSSRFQIVSKTHQMSIKFDLCSYLEQCVLLDHHNIFYQNLLFQLGHLGFQNGCRKFYYYHYQN